MKNNTSLSEFTATLCLMVILFSCSGGKDLHSVSHRKGTEIMQDIKFKKGFALTPLNTMIVKKGGGFDKTYVDTLDFKRDGSHPIWQLAQWNSKYSLANFQAVSEMDRGITYINEGKKVTLFPDHSLLLEVDASREYDSARVKGQPWPHLLISQSFKDMSPNVGEAKQLEFSIEIKLEKCENKMADGTFKPSLHTAHTPFFFVLNNGNKNSKDYNQKIWFGIPSFDYRNVALGDKEKIMWDIGTSTYIYDVPEKAVWGDANLHDKLWHKGHADLKPLILRALEAMKEKGVFVNTKPEDLRITGMNFGWEVPGTFDAAVRVKNISLKNIK